MSDMSDLPQSARHYLDELSFELRFERKYAEEICEEIGGHFYEALACTSEQDAEKAAAELTQGFGSPQFLAADFAAVLMTRKLRNTLFLDLSIMLAIGLAVFNCLSSDKGGPAVFLACASGMVAWAGLLWIQMKNMTGTQLYHWLCTPMIACHITSLSLVIYLLWDFYFSQSSLGLYDGFEITGVILLLARLIHVRKRSKMMCLLWKNVARQG
ncbi:hypothetical protein GA565_24085 [Rouxiella sp. S1S-2]|uniref:hypothetical protein n=1 Tax=Rouxiella sp. S1S-2 TaxID=2653856 RepID=UPI001265835E|nr:hypothetical protein [Rouxiella sp. S1S-2]KAB7893310.1 hypothetical protein GA565_24085 [Rouxiella sp. S1S-2]